jgi:hypothetical protein
MAMPSSTSNSDQRAPELDFGRLFAAVGALIVFGLAAIELALRAAGCGVSFSDSSTRWSIERDKLRRAGANAICVVGASRVHNDINPQVILDTYPDYELIYLPESAVNPIPMMMEVVGNTEFKGLLIVGLTPFQMAARDQPHQPGGIPDVSSIAFYHEFFTPLGRHDELANHAILMALQSRMVVFAHALTPERMLGLRSRQPYRVDRNRFIAMDYSSFSPRELARLNRPGDHDNVEGRASEAAFHHSLSIIRDATAMLKERRGRLVLVRPPMSGNLRELHERLMPKSRYWDRIAEATGAETIHWTELPGLPELVCRDGSHLDYRQAGDFTRALLAELERRGLLPVQDWPGRV